MVASYPLSSTTYLKKKNGGKIVRRSASSSNSYLQTPNLSFCLSLVGLTPLMQTLLPISFTILTFHPRFLCPRFWFQIPNHFLHVAMALKLWLLTSMLSKTWLLSASLMLTLKSSLDTSSNFCSFSKLISWLLTPLHIPNDVPLTSLLMMTLDAFSLS